MAVPTYSTDLVLISDAETTTNQFQFGSGNISLGVGPDFAMQGTNCADGKISNTEKGMGYTGSPTIGANDHVFVWIIVGTAGLTATIVNRGACVLIGSSTTDLVQFHVEGNVTYGVVGRFGKRYPIRYVNTANASPPYRTLNGSPAATPTHFGMSVSMLGAVKGSNVGLDAIHKGTGLYITAGEVANTITLNGIAVWDNEISRRYAVLVKVNATTYELQGRLVIGQNSSQTPTLAHSIDAQIANIFAVDTIHSQTDFTQIIFDHAGTIVNWSNKTLVGLGTNNKGKLVFNNASTAVSWTDNTHVSWGTSVFRAGVTAEGCKWVNCELITLNGAELSNCVIDKSIPASSVDATTLNNITATRFISDGSNHAVRLTSIGIGTMSWSNTLIGYAVGDGSTGNEAIWVDVGTGALTINVSEGATTPSIRTSGATVIVNAGLKTVKFTILDEDTDSPIQYARIEVNKDSDKTNLYQLETNASGVASTNVVYTSDVPVVGWVRQWDLAGDDFTPKDFSGTITEAGLDLTIKLKKITVN